MHIAQLDTHAQGIRFLVRQTTLAFMTAVGAQLAVNAHFFLPFPSPDADAWIIGLGASEGRVCSAFEAPQQNYAYSHTRSWNDVVTARTVIGLSKNRRVVALFAVDARASREGMRLGEIAALLLRDYGVWNALNLDGGGSTTIAWQNPDTGQAELLNTSSDNPAGRAVATSLAVFARRRC